ncbi:hypothetical protein [Streptomyces seoulensis]|uniref:hypothetical protein n=1 Tax=Streptomyces seoulensis TaxID=73044 RepID=UPI003C2B78B6
MDTGTLLDRSVTARHLDDLAGDPALAPRADALRALAQALDSTDATALDAWAELDLLAHFARPESVTQPVVNERGRRFDSVLDWVLGALVFLPLLFTWFGLWRASSAYQALTGRDPKAAGRPFLQLWQSGFDGHLGDTFRFGHVAVAGCLTLATLFVLTLVHGYRRTEADRGAERDHHRSQTTLARLVPILTRAQLSLNEHRFASPQRFAEELSAAAGKLKRMHAKALSTHEELTRAAELVSEAMGSAEQCLIQAETYVRPIEQVVTRIEETVRDSGTAIQAAVKGLDAPLAQAGQRLADVVTAQTGVLDLSREESRTVAEETRDTLRRAADRLESAVSGNSVDVRAALSEAAQRVEDSVTVLAASQRGFTTGVEVVADVNGRLLNDVGAVAERAGEAAELSRQTLIGFEGRSHTLHEAADRFREVTDALVRALHETESARAEVQMARTEAEAVRAEVEAARADTESARAEAETARIRAEVAQERAEGELREAKELRAAIGPAL